MAKIMPVQLDCSCDQPEEEFATDVNLLYYKCNNETPSTIAYPITAPEDILNVLEDKRTIFYIFGYSQHPEDDNVKLIMEALCYGNTDNIVLFDWSKYSNGNYITVFRKAEKVGRLFAASVRKLKNSGLDVSKIYIVAHSLGTHIAGFVGKCNNDFKIPRITALDPANRMYYPIGCYLTSNDASWIDVIHTDAGGFGTLEHMGSAEFYANGGTRTQPGCQMINIPLSDEDLCSHQRSVELYAKSKMSPTEFIAVQCSSHIFYNMNGCNKNEQSGIGYAATPNVTGSFWFSTGEV